MSIKAVTEEDSRKEAIKAKKRKAALANLEKAKEKRLSNTRNRFYEDCIKLDGSNVKKTRDLSEEAARAVLGAFFDEKLGGYHGFIKWASKNKNIFYGKVILKAIEKLAPPTPQVDARKVVFNISGLTAPALENKVKDAIDKALESAEKEISGGDEDD